MWLRGISLHNNKSHQLDDQSRDHALIHVECTASALKLAAAYLNANVAKHRFYDDPAAKSSSRADDGHAHYI